MHYYYLSILYVDFTLFSIRYGRKRKNFFVQGSMFPYYAYDNKLWNLNKDVRLHYFFPTFPRKRWCFLTQMLYTTISYVQSCCGDKRECIWYNSSLLKPLNYLHSLMHPQQDIWLLQTIKLKWSEWNPQHAVILGTIIDDYLVVWPCQSHPCIWDHYSNRLHQADGIPLAMVPACGGSETLCESGITSKTVAKRSIISTV